MITIATVHAVRVVIEASPLQAHLLPKKFREHLCTYAGAPLEILKISAIIRKLVH
jgi:hypothetical protein